MASIHREILIDSTPELVWAALRDVGEVHNRLAPGFVTDTRVQDDIRTVTFADGTVADELIVDLDDRTHRIAYAVVGGSFALRHHHASMQVFPDTDGRSRFVWITDVTPDSFAAPVADMVDQGLRVIRQTLERRPTSAPRRQPQRTSDSSS
ncbi:SRPBCC family protein [Rhodococcus chondri]|uniref:SRPBCC family protein n=1 Tax=Rhodococcus chondri TaxID=3065941 RepID=A0ABU7JTW7_9NOCA|nr:SRPBCC family protein [Rhodococcus sp. CC-R104]MEE2033458.1 SRPBCC family protein [Rhodococcus sp. CC-R104]